MTATPIDLPLFTVSFPALALAEPVSPLAAPTLSRFVRDRAAEDITRVMAVLDRPSSAPYDHDDGVLLRSSKIVTGNHGPDLLTMDALRRIEADCRARVGVADQYDAAVESLDDARQQHAGANAILPLLAVVEALHGVLLDVARVHQRHDAYAPTEWRKP